MVTSSPGLLRQAGGPTLSCCGSYAKEMGVAGLQTALQTLPQRKPTYQKGISGVRLGLCRQLFLFLQVCFCICMFVHPLTIFLWLLGSDVGSRAGYPAQVYKTASAETPRPSQLTQSSPFQLSTLVPKSFFSNQQPVRNKHPAGWKRNDEPSPQPLPFIVPKKQVDTNTKNVFRQPRSHA